MSRLIDELEMIISHNRFPRKIKTGIVSASVSSTKSFEQEINEEITVEARIFVVSKARIRDRQNSLRNASQAIRHAIYADVIELGYRIIDATYEGDCDKVALLTRDLITELMGGNNK